MKAKEVRGEAIPITYQFSEIQAREHFIEACSAGGANVDPRYLMGEADEHGECSGASLKVLLSKHGYEHLIDDLPPGSYSSRPKSKKARKRSAAKAARQAQSRQEPIQQARPR